MKTYFEIADKFFNLCKGGDFNSSEVLLFYTLLIVWNRNERKEWFPVYNDELRYATKYNLKTIQSARNKLYQKGIIGYKKGGIGKAAKYSILL